MVLPKVSFCPLFQSTLSVRRATQAEVDSVKADAEFQSTLSVRRATRKTILQVSRN